MKVYAVYFLNDFINLYRNKDKAEAFVEMANEFNGFECYSIRELDFED